MKLDNDELKNLIVQTNGDKDLAEEIQEDFFHLGIAMLAAFTFVPINVSKKTQTQKEKISKIIANKLLEQCNLTFAENWLKFLKHPTSCINVLKALYHLCMSSVKICLFVSKNKATVNTLIDILSENVIYSYSSKNLYKGLRLNKFSF